MTVDIEKRVTDIETLVWELPNLINTRFHRFDAEFTSSRTAIADNTARLVQVERAMTLLQADLRDLRSGVTRQLVEQERRLAAIESRLDKLESRLEKLESRMDNLEKRFGVVEGRLDGLEGKIDRLSGQMAEALVILARLGGAA